jgi:K+-transporting ATPase ATPase C chain
MLRPALVTFTGLTVLAGIAYPLAVTGVASLCFPRQAKGSLLVREGQVVGSALIAQQTEQPRYFWGRLSATAGFATNAGLLQSAQARLGALRAADPGNHDPVPADLLTASGSGLDPHISPQAACYQAARVARARNLTKAVVLERITMATEHRKWGLLGEPRVNVLKLNLALDALH